MDSWTYVCSVRPQRSGSWYMRPCRDREEQLTASMAGTQNMYPSTAQTQCIFMGITQDIQGPQRMDPDHLR